MYWNFISTILVHDINGIILSFAITINHAYVKWKINVCLLCVVAPQPPQRDPQTSLSVGKAQGKQYAEGMAELGGYRGPLGPQKECMTLIQELLYSKPYFVGKVFS